MHLERLEKLNTKDCLWIYILSIIKKEPMHAYAIRKEIGRKFGFLPGTVTAYKVLYLLNRAGVVDKRKDGRRVLYSITPKGRADLKKAIGFYREMIGLLER